MKLSKERLEELRGMGINVAQQPLVNQSKETDSKPLPPKQSPPKDHTELILKLIAAESTNTEKLVQLNQVIAKVLQTMNQKQPKKKFVCSVGRDGKGDINKVNIIEE